MNSFYKINILTKKVLVRHLNVVRLGWLKFGRASKGFGQVKESIGTSKNYQINTQ